MSSQVTNFFIAEVNIELFTPQTTIRGERVQISLLLWHAYSFSFIAVDLEFFYALYSLPWPQI